MKRIRNKKMFQKFPEPAFLPKVRNTTFQPEYIRLFFYFSLMGANQSQICKAFGINVSTLKKWKEKIPEVERAIRSGSLEADARVAEAMYHAAIGYTHDEEVILTNRVQEFDDNGKVVRQYTEPLRVVTKKHYPPNVTAGFKWLSARQPEAWKENHTIKAEIRHSHSVDLSHFSTEELEILNKLNVLQKPGEEDSNIIDIPYEDEV